MIARRSKLAEGAQFGMELGANVVKEATLVERFRPFKGRYDVECYDKRGRLKWRETIDNIHVNVGLDAVLDVHFSAATQITTWFLGLTDGTPTVAAGDTMASHAGWAEITAYSESVRQTFVEAGVSGQSLDNSASKASYAINGSATVGGAFLTSVNTKSGSTGTLASVGAFTGGDRSVVSGDTVLVTLTITAADDGV